MSKVFECRKVVSQLSVAHSWTFDQTLSNYAGQIYMFLPALKKSSDLCKPQCPLVGIKVDNRSVWNEFLVGYIQTGAGTFRRRIPRFLRNIYPHGY